MSIGIKERQFCFHGGILLYVTIGCLVHRNSLGRENKLNDEELQRLVEEISLSFFHKPFKHRAYFNHRLRTTGGRYLLRTNNIEVNRKYLDQLGKEELVGIIKHELCHYHLHLEGKGYKHRDKDFKDLLKKVGAPRYCSILPNRPQRKRSSRIYYYECTECEMIYERKRRMDTTRYVCGKCRGRIKERV